MRTMRRVSLSLLAVSGVQAYHQSEFEGLWEQVPQTCINVRAGDTTRDSTAKEMPSWSGYGDVSYRCENDPYCEGRFRVYESDFGRHGWWGDEYDRSDWAKMQAICAWFGDICGGVQSTAGRIRSSPRRAHRDRRRRRRPPPRARHLSSCRRNFSPTPRPHLCPL